MTLKCQCCGFEQNFIDAEDAFERGWDAPPYFTQIICCNLCPVSWIVLGKSHADIHEQWKLKGRPKDFGPECVGLVN